MKLVKWGLGALAFLLLVFGTSVFNIASAQQTLGSVNGTVTDPSGAAIPGARVSVVSNQTGLSRSVATRGNGSFEVLNLPVGTYTVSVTATGFDQEQYPTIQVQEARATTINSTLKVGNTNQSITVNANPLLNATDTTNGYTMNKAQIDAVPLATGSFTQLAILAPGTSADFISGIGTNQGLGNQLVWTNGQRATDNTFSVNGVDVTNLFNGLSSSDLNSQRFQFNIGEGHNTGGESQDSTTVYGSNGNGLASPPPTFMQEVQVTTSMYDAQQGQTSGAHVDVNTSTGSNRFHGDVYGNRSTNAFNASPYFYKQDVGLGFLNPIYEDPQLHRWTAGGTLGGPIKKDKLFFFIGYQHIYTSDQYGALSQFQVPYGLSDDRSLTGINNALCSYQTISGKSCSPIATPNPTAVALLQAKLPNGQYLIPSPTGGAATAQANLMAGNPDVTLLGTSVFKGDQAVADLDYNPTSTDHLSAKYYYQHAPVTSPYSISNVSGFPQLTDNGAQVAAISNSITFGSKVNWEQRLGFSHQKVYSSFDPLFTASDFGFAIPGGNYFPGLGLSDFAQATSNSKSLTVGPDTAFAAAGYFENRLSPSTTAIFSLGNHAISVGFDLNYNQLNIRNQDVGRATLAVSNFQNFLSGKVKSGTVLEGYADRHYRSSDVGSYIMDKWQVRPNITITAGLRYDFDGPFSEENGLLFNFDPTLYQSNPNQIVNTGFIVAGNNKQYGTSGVSDSTLKGRQWGLAPRVGIAWSPKAFHGNVVWRAGAGIYYDRGEYFQYLSPPAGQGISGPFGVTEEAPFAAYTNVNGNLSSPFSKGLTQPVTPSTLASTLPTLNSEEQTCTAAGVYSGSGDSGYYCAAIPAIIGNYNLNNKLPYTENWTLDFQWQPRNDLSVDIAYVGNRGKHMVLPIPFNEPGLATPTSPINGQQYSYGVQVLSPTATDASGNPLPSAYEPYDTYSGGNVDLRVPYTGYDPNSTSFEARGISSYDALQAHMEKRLSHNIQGGLSYTWSHALDEQSDVGLFFTGDNPSDLRSSYADADFDRTNVLAANLLVNLPNAIKSKSNWLHFVTNDWSLTGVGFAQSGQPYSIYDFSGAVGNQYFGGNVNEINPVLPLKPGIRPRQAETGFSGAQGQVNPNEAALNAFDFEVPLVAPGQHGAPPCDTTTAGGNAGPGGGPLCDVYETDFVPGQRNIFRQSFQRRMDITLQKRVTFKSRYSLLYQFQVFNVTNTPSFDVPNNNISLAPTYLEVGGSGSGTQVQPSPGPVQVPSGTGTVTANCQGASSACAWEAYTPPTNGNSSSLGVVQNTIGSNRIIEMAMHLNF